MREPPGEGGTVERVEGHFSQESEKGPASRGGFRHEFHRKGGWVRLPGEKYEWQAEILAWRSKATFLP